jgi:hypothetical protein
MIVFFCRSCDSTFQAETSRPCYQCGSVDVEQIASVVPAEEEKAARKILPATQELLRRLRRGTKEPLGSCQGEEWDLLLNAVREELQPYLKGR